MPTPTPLLMQLAISRVMMVAAETAVRAVAAATNGVLEKGECSEIEVVDGRGNASGKYSRNTQIVYELKK